MALRLTPQKREFFDLFNEAALNAREISRLLVELLEGWPDSRQLLLDIRALATVVDDICDHVDEAADDIDAYEVTEVPPRAVEQGEVIYRAASRLCEAMELLEGFGDAHKHLFALRELEDEGDRLSREAVADLFRSGQDPLTIIRWKDIHEQLEEAVDACENAADVLEAILVKNR
jgi:uncharacterized protein Yka (UPF0111/DUF47 family)